MEALGLLVEADLVSLGVNKLGHRKKMLSAISRLPNSTIQFTFLCCFSSLFIFLTICSIENPSITDNVQRTPSSVSLNATSSPNTNELDIGRESTQQVLNGLVQILQLQTKLLNSTTNNRRSHSKRKGDTDSDSSESSEGSKSSRDGESNASNEVSSDEGMEGLKGKKINRDGEIEESGSVKPHIGVNIKEIGTTIIDFPLSNTLAAKTGSSLSEIFFTFTKFILVASDSNNPFLCNFRNGNSIIADDFRQSQGMGEAEAEEEELNSAYEPYYFYYSY